MSKIMKNIKNNTTLKVTDFGPISRAEIDLRPLTIFLGPSHTGKSYMATLIYALHCSLSDTVSSLGEGSLLNRQSYFRSEGLLCGADDVKKDDLDEVITWAKEIGENLNISSSLKDSERSRKHSDKIKKDSNRIIMISDIVIRLLRPVFEKQATSVTRELSRCFAMEPDDLKRKHSQENPKISINYQASVESGMQSFDLLINPVEEKLKSNFSKGFKIEFNEEQFEEFTHIIERFLLQLLMTTHDDDDESELRFKSSIEYFLSLLANLIQLSLTGPLNYPAFYLPADRPGIMHVYNVVVSALIHNATMGGIRHANSTPFLSGVLADFMDGLISINPHMDSNKRKHKDITNQIEDILEGKVHIEQDEVSNYPRFTYQPEGWTETMPLMNASSLVSELAPVIFYLRYKILSGNVLIIEEPESHLHPENQVAFIDLIAGLINSGIRVIMTTHSQWIIEGLSNVVQRSQLLTATKKSSKDEFALNPEMVGVWLFKKDAKTGSTVEEITFDDNMYSSDFGEVAKNLYNDWVELIGREKNV